MRQGKVLTGTVLSLLLIAASAAAEEKIEEKKNPWRGSAVTYEHSVSAISLDKAAEPTWNPYYGHSLSLRPEWHFTDDFFVRARFDIEQELTNSDETTLRHEWLWNDLRIDAAYAGYKEPTTGIKVSGDLRLVAPTSRAAIASSLIFGLAPAVNLSRKFDVMDGLVVGYSARHQWNVHAYSTPRYDEVGFPCHDASPECAMLVNTGIGNVKRVLQHGPMVMFSPVEKLEITMMMSFFRSSLYDFDPASVPVEGGQAGVGDASQYQVRYANLFAIEAGYQLLEYLGLSLGVSTFGGQLKPDSTYREPFFNRNTAFMLDMNIDIDALYSKI